MKGSRTRKVIALGCAVCMLYGVAALAATPQKGEYAGTTENGSGVDFGLVKKHGKLKVSAFTLSNFGFTCRGGGGGHSNGFEATATVNVKNDTFEIDQTIDEDRLKVHGELRKGTKAKGTLKWTTDGDDFHCTTKKLDWTAKLKQ